MLRLKLQYFGHPMWRADSLKKTLVLGKIEGRRRRGDRGWDGLMASPPQWTWVWAGSRRWWWTGKPGVLQSMGRKEPDKTEQLSKNITPILTSNIFFPPCSCFSFWYSKTMHRWDLLKWPHSSWILCSMFSFFFSLCVSLWEVSIDLCSSSLILSSDILITDEQIEGILHFCYSIFPSDISFWFFLIVSTSLLTFTHLFLYVVCFFHQST